MEYCKTFFLIKDLDCFHILWFVSMRKRMLHGRRQSLIEEIIYDEMTLTRTLALQIDICNILFP